MNTAQAIHTSEIWLNNSQKPDNYRPALPQCPSYRFSCPECGSLEVFISKKNPSLPKGTCLDCKSEWKEGFI